VGGGAGFGVIPAHHVEIQERLLPWLGFVVERFFGRDQDDTGEDIRRLLAEALPRCLRGK